MAYNDLARLAHARGEDGRALDLGHKALTMFREMGDHQGLAETLEGLAAASSPTPEAARLFGAAQSLRTALGAPVPPVEQPAYDKDVAAVRQALDTETFEAAWRAGQQQPLS